MRNRFIKVQGRTGPSTSFPLFTPGLVVTCPPNAGVEQIIIRVGGSDRCPAEGLSHFVLRDISGFECAIDRTCTPTHARPNSMQGAQADQEHCWIQQGQNDPVGVFWICTLYLLRIFDSNFRGPSPVICLSTSSVADHRTRQHSLFGKSATELPDLRTVFLYCNLTRELALLEMCGGCW